MAWALLVTSVIGRGHRQKKKRTGRSSQLGLCFFTWKSNEQRQYQTNSCLVAQHTTVDYPRINGLALCSTCSFHYIDDYSVNTNDYISLHFILHFLQPTSSQLASWITRNASQLPNWTREKTNRYPWKLTLEIKQANLSLKIIEPLRHKAINQINEEETHTFTHICPPFLYP